jgi:hypothetical protein
MYRRAGSWHQGSSADAASVGMRPYVACQASTTRSTTVDYNSSRIQFAQMLSTAMLT